MNVIWIVPNDFPNATSIKLELPDHIDLSGRWEDVMKRIASLVPKGFHVVMLG